MTLPAASLGTSTTDGQDRTGQDRTGQDRTGHTCTHEEVKRKKKNIFTIYIYIDVDKKIETREIEEAWMKEKSNKER